MSALNKFLACAVGTAAALATASPAAAQYYSGNAYPNYGYSYDHSVGNAVDQVINGVVGATQYGNYPNGNYGYGQSYGYGLNANTAVGQCSRAVEARLGGGYGGGGRVTGVRNIEQRNNGALRVNGFASNYSGYGYGQPNLTFSCKVDRYARVTDLRVERADGYNGFDGNGYDRGYRGW